MRDKFLPRCVAPSLILLAVGLPVGIAAADPERPRRDTLNAKLFPLAVGHKWLYAFGDKEVVFEVLSTEKLKAAETDDLTLYVVRRTIDKTAVVFKIAVEEDGVYVHQEGEKEFRPPLRQFAFFARSGDEWKWKGRAGGKQETRRFEHSGVQQVTVPAGTFSSVAVYQHGSESGEHATFWLARDVGIVKVSGKTEVLPDGAGEGPVLFEWTLKKFATKTIDGK